MTERRTREVKQLALLGFTTTARRLKKMEKYHAHDYRRVQRAIDHVSALLLKRTRLSHLFKLVGDDVVPATTELIVLAEEPSVERIDALAADAGLDSLSAKLAWLLAEGLLARATVEPANAPASRAVWMGEGRAYSLKLDRTGFKRAAGPLINLTTRTRSQDTARVMADNLASLRKRRARLALLLPQKAAPIAVKVESESERRARLILLMGGDKQHGELVEYLLGVEACQ